MPLFLISIFHFFGMVFSCLGTAVRTQQVLYTFTYIISDASGLIARSPRPWNPLEIQIIRENLPVIYSGILGRRSVLCLART